MSALSAAERQSQLTQPIMDRRTEVELLVERNTDDDDDDDIAHEYSEEAKILERLGMHAAMTAAKADHKKGSFWQDWRIVLGYESLAVLIYWTAMIFKVITITQNIQNSNNWTMNGTWIAMLFIDFASLLLGNLGKSNYNSQMDCTLRCVLTWPIRGCLLALYHTDNDNHDHQNHSDDHPVSPPSDTRTKLHNFQVEYMERHGYSFSMSSLVSCLPFAIIETGYMMNHNNHSDSGDDRTYWFNLTAIILNVFPLCYFVITEIIFAFDQPEFMLKYLSYSTDIVIVIASIIWCFCGGSDHCCLTDLAWIAIDKFIYFSLPETVIFTAVIYIYLMRTAREPDDEDDSCLVALVCCSPAFYPMIAVFNFLNLEVRAYSAISYLLCDVLFLDRLGSKSSESVYWERVVKFVNQGYSDKDKMLRVITVNECLLSEREINDDGLKSYLKKNQRTGYTDVSWETLRNHSAHRDAANNPLILLIARLKSHLEGGLMNRMWPLCVLLLSLHLISKLFNVAFVWIGLAYISPSDLSAAHYLSAGMLFVLQLSWLLCLVWFLRSDHAMWHIMPGHLGMSVSIKDADQAHLKVQCIIDSYASKLAWMELSRLFDNDVSETIVSFL